MLKRLPLAVLAAVIVAVSGFAVTTAPARADRDDHHVKYHPAHPAHWNRPPNPYGANGYWSHGAWHNRAANPGRHTGWVKHPHHPKHDRDRR
jgi:hypothetical protein